MEPSVGLEPTTYRLQGGCSTTELTRRVLRAYEPDWPRTRATSYTASAAAADTLSDDT